MGQHHSPYLAMSNNPVSFTDPDGGWDGDDGYDRAMGDIMERNNFNFLAASIEANGQMNWNGMSPSDRHTIQKMFGTSYKAQFENRIMDNIDAFGSYSERGVDYYYSEKRGVYGYWKDENTLTGAVKQFHTKSGSGWMGSHITGNITMWSTFHRIGGDATLTNIRLKNQLRDNIMQGLKTVESFNPFSNLWDATSMLVYGTDKYGNDGSFIGFSYAILAAVPLTSLETYGVNFTKAETEASKRLGFFPGDVSINRKVADIPITYITKVSLSDITTVSDALRAHGAKSMRINAGPIINPTITSRINGAYELRKPFLGFKITKTGNPNNMFILTKKL